MAARRAHRCRCRVPRAPLEPRRPLRYTPTFAFYKNNVRVDELYGNNAQSLADHVWLHADG